MIFFEVDFLNFLADLEINNNREWFNANKDRFKAKVEAPFHSFIGRVIELLQKENPKFTITPKEAIFRIYKDVRFSKDKTPYKTHMSALISSYGKKEISAPGLYLEFSADNLHIYSGIYQPDPQSLYKIRTHIAKNQKEFLKLYSSKSFTQTFDVIKGEKNKVIPAEFKNAAIHEPLLYNKAFYYFSINDSELLLKEGLDKLVLHTYKVAQPMNEFLEMALV
ncbi:MAG: DUF2461 domain-containing protein [Saprospiraceae bacterium]|nr:DUF2461 domain-containing protein [Candidatus Vicinibacter affinis]